MPIKKIGKRKFKIKNVKGTSPSKAAAKKRLRAVKASQAKRKKK